jgi:aldehyde dehydrogenase (NAD+)
VEAARRAQPGWVALGGHGRARVMYALARLLQKHARLFAVLETLDNGKTIRETRDADLPLAARHFYHHAGWAQLQSEEFADYRAVGVVGQIVPWNFPLLMLAWKIAPALAAGNTIVFKPAEFTSLTALLFAEICQQAGVPAGVVNIVTGDGRVGEAIVNHPASTSWPSPARPKSAASSARPPPAAARSCRWNWAASRPSSSSTTPTWTPPSKAWSIRSGSTRARSAAPVRACWCRNRCTSASSPSCARAWRTCASARRWTSRWTSARWSIRCSSSASTAWWNRPAPKAATVYQPACEAPANGSWYPPTLITGASTSAAVAQTEIFGPVLVAMSFRTPGEAVQLANNTVYGLAACVWSESISLALDVAPQIKAGVVWINTANQFDAACGFGGYRESGFGREGGKRRHVRVPDPAVGRCASGRAGRGSQGQGQGGSGQPVRHRPHRQAVHRRQAGPP